ncbi:MAG TPA: hypothetical protein VF637_03065 [Sphingomicrobium sp.]
MKAFSPQDDVPYANFDGHGFVAIGGWLSALLFAVPIFWLARRIIVPADVVENFPTTSVDKTASLGIGFVALAMCLPSFVQTVYLAALPVKVVWPVVASALAWMTTVLVFWITFNRRADAKGLAESLKTRALLLAALIALPKLLLVGTWAVRGS